MIIAKKFEFEAAHRLPQDECFGACSNLHGHTYKLIVELEGETNNNGWVMNFKDLKNIINTKIIDRLDHSYLNDIVELPTAENLIFWMQEQINDSLKDNIKLRSITLYETSDSYAKFII